MESVLRGSAQAGQPGLVGVAEDLRELLGAFLSLRNEAQTEEAEAAREEADLQSTHKPQETREAPAPEVERESVPEIDAAMVTARTRSHAVPSRRPSGASLSVVSLRTADERRGVDFAKADLLELWSYVTGPRGRGRGQELVSAAPSALRVNEVLAHEKVLDWLYGERDGGGPQRQRPMEQQQCEYAVVSVPSHSHSGSFVLV